MDAANRKPDRQSTAGGLFPLGYELWRRADQRGHRYFDTGCFGRPEANRFGNSGRNILPGPGAQFWDTALGREFRLERVRIDFRAEVYSVFNHQNWNTPDVGVVNPNFGRIFGKNTPRRFQFGTRIEF